MKKIIGDNFSKVSKYKLYRTVYEIIHPTISKRNISNYKIVLDDKFYPVVAYYPKKISNLSSAIIYIPGDGEVSNCYGKYDEICKNLALNTNKLVIAVDYFDDNIKYPTTINKCCKLMNFLVAELEENGISKDKVVLMGDSTGCSILGNVVLKMRDKKKYFSKMVLFYPTIRENYDNYIWNESLLNLNFNLDKRIVNYFKKYIGKTDKSWDLINLNDFYCFPKTLVIGGEMDLLKDEGILLAEKMNSFVDGCRCHNIMYASHGFLNGNDEIMLEEAYKIIIDFV